MPFKNKEDAAKYHKEYHKQWYQKNRETQIVKHKKRKQDIRKWLKEYKKTLKCSFCPENHPSCLDFHHKHKKNGVNSSVSVMVSTSKSIGNIKKEISKCIVVCSNCHRKLHWEEVGNNDWDN